MKRLLSLCLILTLGFSIAQAKPKKLTADLRWDFLPAEGTLVISGHGAMPDWHTPQEEAWFKDKLWHKIHKIVIEEGVTAIGFKSFSPVGESFKRVDPLTIQLPSTLEKIGDFAFKGTPLGQLTLPDHLRTIGMGAFSGSLKQGELNVPASVVLIADGAFMRCQISKVAFHGDALVRAGAFFECKPLTTVSFGNAWTELAAGAFEGNHKLIELLEAENVRMPGANPFIRTPLERSPIVVAMMGMPQASEEEKLAKAEEAKNQTEGKRTRTLLAELDRNIPVMDGIDRDHTFALVIGNENYRREAAVPFASNDSHIFAQYLTKTLGIPEKNVTLIEDASLNDMKYGLNLLAKTCNAFDGKASIIVYYAGHGVPDESTKDAFLLPVDGYGADTSTGYSVKTLYDRLGAMPTRSSVLFMDACFSGAKREGEMLASARGIAIAPTAAQTSGNLVVFSAAQGDETAFAYDEQGHGMFTYFLLKKLQQNMGDVTLGELSDFVITNVRQSSITENHKSQTPSVISPENLGEAWRDIRL